MPFAYRRQGTSFNDLYPLLTDGKVPEEVRRSNEEKLAQSETEVVRLTDALAVLASLDS